MFYSSLSIDIFSKILHFLSVDAVLNLLTKHWTEEVLIDRLTKNLSLVGKG